MKEIVIGECKDRIPLRDAIGSGRMKPSTDVPDAVNAARMSFYAEAAYVDIGSTLLSWSHHHANGVIQCVGNDVFIGIAGTNDVDDARNDVDLLRMSLQDWSLMMGIPLSTSRDVYSTSGFLHFTAFAYRGIMNCVRDNRFDLTNANVWIAGHSLGGAAATLLQLTVPFENARCFTFGAPKVFDDHDGIPERIRVAVRRVTDPVAYFPMGMHHPPANTFYVRYRGALARRMPWYYWPASWCLGATAWARSFRSLSGVFRGHSMTRYASDLQPLR